MKYITIFCGLLLFCVPGCDSSLDLDTRRIETLSPVIPPDPVLNITDFSVTTSVTGFTPQGPTAWNYVAIIESFMVDFTSSPPVFSLDYQLQRPAGSPTTSFVLENLHLRLEDMTADGVTTAISGFPGTGTGFFADGNFSVGTPPSITYTTDPSISGSTPYSASGIFTYSALPSPILEGEITVTMQLPQNTRPTFIIAFTAEEL